MKSPYIIGIDIGTTHTKAVAFDAAGNVLGMKTSGYQMKHPMPGRAELDPSLIFRAVVQSINGLSGYLGAHYLAGIGFSAAMHSLICVDKAGKPLTPCITWADNRSAGIAAVLRREHLSYYHLTGTPLHAMSPLCKLIWLRENDPVLFENTAIFSGIKEYIWYRLTGEWSCDISTASATGWMDLRKKTWANACLQLSGIRETKLPDLVTPLHRVDYKNTKHSVLRIPEGTPLIIGASDGVLSHSGSGARWDGDYSVTIGTSSAIRTLLPDIATDPDMRTFCYLTAALQPLAGGGSNAGGYVLQWLKNSLFQRKGGYEPLFAKAATVPPGCDGLLMVPYLMGERAPWWDEHLTGNFTGIHTRHGQGHFLRACLEGVVYHLRLLGDILGEGVAMRRLMASGGFTRHPLWLQIAADVFQLPVYVNAPSDAAVRGAAMLAVEALGMDAFTEAAAAGITAPVTALSDVYQERYAAFRRETTARIRT